MPRYFDPEESLTFVCIYLRNGEKVYRSSRLKEDRISRGTGMKGLRHRFIDRGYKGRFHTAIIFDNKSKKPLERYDEYGKKIYDHGNDRL
jgi:hypothetical protein